MGNKHSTTAATAATAAAARASSTTGSRSRWTMIPDGSSWVVRARTWNGGKMSVSPDTALVEALNRDEEMHALLFQGPITVALASAVLAYLRRGNSLVYVNFVGYGGVNTKELEKCKGLLDRLIAALRAAGTVAEILPATLSRQFACDTNISNKLLLGQVLQVFKWTALSNIVSPSKALTVRIFTANCGTLRNFAVQSGATDDEASWAFGSATARAYLDSAVAAGNFSADGTKLGVQMTNAHACVLDVVGGGPPLTPEVAAVARAQLAGRAAKTHGPERTLLLVATLKFALLHALCGRPGRLYTNDGVFTIPDRDKFSADLGGHVNRTAVDELTKRLCATPGIGLTPPYDLLSAFAMHYYDKTGSLLTDAFARAAAAADKSDGKGDDGRAAASTAELREMIADQIRESLNEGVPRMIGAARIKIVASLNDVAEEGDDQMSVWHALTRAGPSFDWRFYLTAGSMTHEQRLVHALPFATAPPPSHTQH